MKKSNTLQSIIYKNFLSSSLIPILVIEIALLLLYFGINAHITEKNQITFEQEAKSDIIEISKREVTNINRQLEEITRNAVMMQKEHERFFAHPNNCFIYGKDPQFAKHPNGAYYKTVDNGGGSIYYSNTTNMGKKEILKARCSEMLDPLLISIVEGNPLVTQAYLNTWDDMNRIYPFIPNSPEVYGPEIEMELHNFYYEADEKRNPSKKPVWTSAYLDPAGQGWMISNIVPIYNKDFLEGVSGLDVTIDSFVKNILSMQLPWEASAFMVDKTGTILAMPEKIERILDLKELKEHVYKNSVKGTIEKPEEYNIFRNKNSEVKKQMIRLFNSKDEIDTFSINGTTYFISQEIIQETGWRMFTVVDREIALAQVAYLESLSKKIGYLAIAAMVIFYIVFFLYLLKKSKELGKRIAMPIELLTKQSTDFGKGIVLDNIDETGISEIDTLVSNFNTMSQELTKRSDDLIETTIRKEIAIKEAQIFQELSITDPLTKISNRLKADQVITKEFEKARRENLSFGVIILDIDHFKEVNDVFGHQSGDKVLIKIATMLQENIGIHDTVGRWGGEEFLVITPNAEIEKAKELAESLRSAVESYKFDVVNTQTVSVGVSCFKKSDKSIDDLIKRADDALYKSKHNGRNSTTVIF